MTAGKKGRPLEGTAPDDPAVEPVNLIDDTTSDEDPAFELIKRGAR